MQRVSTSGELRHHLLRPLDGAYRARAADILVLARYAVGTSREHMTRSKAWAMHAAVHELVATLALDEASGEQWTRPRFRLYGGRTERDSHEHSFGSRCGGTSGH